MSSVPLNIFQKLMRRWDSVHPYNAAQVMKLAGSPQHAVWENAWRAMLRQTGLGTVSIDRDRYQFCPPEYDTSANFVAFPNFTLEEYLSTQMNRPFADGSEVPFRPFVIQGDGYFYAGVVYQHWMADSASIRLLTREWFFHVYDPESASTHSLKLAKRGYWETVGPARGGWGLTEGILDMTRRHVRLRKVRKIASTALDDHATRFQLIAAKAGLIEHVRCASHQRRVKVNDVFLAALVEACAAHIPMQVRKKRTDVAVGSVVDLRPYCPKSLGNAFGLFLGFTNVIAQPVELRSFDRILSSVSRQTRLQKSTGVAPASLMWMTAAMYVGLLSKPDELYHFYRKELPLAGGISNVDLTREWMADYHPSLLLDYIRVSPTGPMTPLVITTTTLKDQFHLGVTYRTGLVSDELAATVTNAILSRLEKL